jgi:DNA gyrase subunit A
VAKNGKESIIFTEIPYGVNKASLLVKIAELVRDKVIDGIAEIRDESDREGLRIVIELKKGTIAKVVLNQLFSHTALQSTFGVINLALVGLRPKCLSLKELIAYYVEHRVEVVTRRTKYDLQKAEERAHILEGLMIALANIDEVVAIIKASRDVELAKTNLIQRFVLTEIQAQAIVDMRLGRLTSLEVEKLQKELEELRTLISYLKSLLEDKAKLMGVIKDELRSVAEKYGDPRRTEIVADEIESINIEDLIQKEEMVILISNLGYIKRVPVSSYKSQGRGGKGMASAKLAEEDFIEQLFVATTHDHLMFITSKGRAYWLKVHEIPEGSRTSKGVHIKSLLMVSPNEEITTVVDIREFRDDTYLLLATTRGIVKKVQTSEFSNAKTRGIIAISLDEGDTLVSALLTGGSDEIMMISRKGQALRTHEEQIRPMGRSSRGVTGMKLDVDDELAGLLRVNDEEKMLIVTEYGYGKRVEYAEFSAHNRATGGQRVYTITEKTGEIVSCVSVKEDDDIMCITSQGKSIKLAAKEISVMGRSAQGVRLLQIERPDFVIGVDRIANEEE